MALTRRPHRTPRSLAWPSSSWAVPTPSTVTRRNGSSTRRATHSDLHVDLQRRMVASCGPLRPVKDLHRDQVRDPSGRYEAEVDVPWLGRLVVVTIGRMGLVTVLHVLKGVIRADQSEVGECIENSRM